MFWKKIALSAAVSAALEAAVVLGATAGAFGLAVLLFDPEQRFVGRVRPGRGAAAREGAG